MALMLLAAAILCEVAATLSLRASAGFSRHPFIAVVVLGYLSAFVLLSEALERGLSLGVAYGIWAAAGVALVALLGWAMFGERLTAAQGAGVVLIIAGVLALELGAADQG